MPISRRFMRQTLVLLSFFFVGVSGCSEQPQPRTASPRPVVVTKLTATDPSRALRLTGVAESWAEEDIAFEVSGRVDYIVEEGTYLEGRWVENEDVVTKGDVLATINRAAYEAALQAAKAEVDHARIHLNRVLPAKLVESEANQVDKDTQYAKIEQLHKKLSATDVELIEYRAARDAAGAQVDQVKAEFEGGKASLAKAKAALVQAELDLEHATLPAPFTGEVAEVYVKAGGFVKAGQSVARLVTMDPVKIDVTVSAQTNRKIHVDDFVRVFIPGQDEPFVGKVYQKSTVADPATRTFPVTLISRNMKMLVNPTGNPEVLALPRIKGVMPATRVAMNESGSLWVEEKQALRLDDNGHFVWTLEGVSMREGIDSSNPVFVVRKVHVVPGKGRMNLQGLYFLRELKDAGTLQFLQALALGVPEGVQEGDRVALLHESWLLQPGQLVDVQFKRDAAQPGYYVPFQAIMPTAEGAGYILVVDESVAPAAAKKIEVALGKTFGEWQRIEGDAMANLGDDVSVIVEGVNYVQPGEPVTILQTQAPLP